MNKTWVDLPSTLQHIKRMTRCLRLLQKQGLVRATRHVQSCPCFWRGDFHEMNASPCHPTHPNKNSASWIQIWQEMDTKVKEKVGILRTFNYTKFINHTNTIYFTKATELVFMLRTWLHFSSTQITKGSVQKWYSFHESKANIKPGKLKHGMTRQLSGIVQSLNIKPYISCK